VRLGPGTEYAGWWPRCAGAALDLALLALVAAPIAALLVHGAAPGDTGSPAPALLARAVPPVNAITVACALFLAGLLFSQPVTPGSLLLGVRLVGARDGRRPAWWRVLVRAVVFVPAAAALGIGLLWMFRDPRRQGWHDKLSGTLAVHEDESRLTLDELLECLG